MGNTHTPHYSNCYIPSTVPSSHLPTIGSALSRAGHHKSTPESKMAAKQIAEKLISEHFVTVFSKTYCPYCKRAKDIINSLSLPAGKVSVLELDNESNGSDIQAYLGEKTGQRTVPNIFIGGKHVGGCDDITRLQQSGELKKLVAAA